MIDFLDIRDIIAIFGLFTGFGYYVLSVRGTKRNQQLQLETRQAKLFMSLYNDFKTKDFQNDFYVAMEFEFKDFDDFFEQTQGPDNRELFLKIMNFGYFMEGLGVLLNQGVIDPVMIEELMGGNIRRYGEKYRPIIDEFRKTNPSFGEWGLYLIDEMNK